MFTSFDGWDSGNSHCSAPIRAWFPRKTWRAPCQVLPIRPPVEIVHHPLLLSMHIRDKPRPIFLGLLVLLLLLGLLLNFLRRADIFQRDLALLLFIIILRAWAQTWQITRHFLSFTLVVIMKFLYCVRIFNNSWRNVALRLIKYYQFVYLFWKLLYKSSPNMYCYKE